MTIKQTYKETSRRSAKYINSTVNMVKRCMDRLEYYVIIPSSEIEDGTESS